MLETDLADTVSREIRTPDKKTARGLRPHSPNASRPIAIRDHASLYPLPIRTCRRRSLSGHVTTRSFGGESRIRPTKFHR